MHNIYLKDLIRICNGKLINGNLDETLINFSKIREQWQREVFMLVLKGK